MHSIMLNLPMPPSANRMWTIVTIRKRGQRPRKGLIKTRAYRRWLRDAGWKAMLQHPKAIKGPYKLTIQAEQPKNRSRDCDNIIKPVNDLLQSLMLVENDKFCDDSSAKWAAVIGITVLVEPMEAA